MKEKFLNQLRDRSLPIWNFREISLSLSKLMASEIIKQIPKSEKVILIAILRAGLALLPAFQEKFIGAPIGLIGIRREEETALPHLYYEKLPPFSPSDHILVLDPILATGGSANLALDLLKKRGGKKGTLISVISAPEGISLIQQNHPSISLYTVVKDQGLDAKKFIVPGIGDFGDRYFGTI